MLSRESEIERICQAALDCPSEARAELLATECRDDEEMRREVERLLAFETAADRFLERQALTVPSDSVHMRFSPSSGLGAWARCTAGETPCSAAMWR